MKSLLLSALALTLLSVAGAANAQQGAPADSAQVSNPVSTTVKGQMPRFAKNMVEAAAAMPAEKFSFKPSPEMNSYGHLVLHIAQTNNFLCAKISAASAPDVKLADPLVLFGNRPSSRAGALIGLSDGWFDHYSTQAIYLRLNGILPPSAQPPAAQPSKQ
jgi:hypothetical protein